MSIICNSCNIPNKDEALYCNKCGARLVETTLTEGKILDKRYEILELIKTGGMGAVYKARDDRLTQICAVKELLSSSIDDEEYAVKRFHEEAKILASLRHSNLPRVIDHFTEHGKYYLVMDFIDGQDLETILNTSNRGGLDEDKVIEYTKQLLDVFIYLHSQNPPVVYRDLKPSNIMVQSSDGRIILIDFGIARTVRPGSLTKKTGIGTEGYIAPEQYTGKPEPASDIYSLGATIHHLITGQKPLIPFNFKPVKELKPCISEGFHNIIMKSLQMKPEARFTAQEMKKAVYGLKRTEIYKQDISPGSYSNPKTESPRKGFFSYFSLTRKIRATSDETIVNSEDKSSMILIPKGYFFMGDNNSESNECPERKIFLDDYYIDTYPVTNIQYNIFIKNTSYESQGKWWKYFSEKTEDHPVINISWQDAKAYADWAGKRLLSEAEWEKAARGTDRRKYPWGNKWDKNLCNNRELDIRELKEKMSDIVNGRGTLPVGSFPGGASPYGVMDMAGQVIEWCSDWYDPHYYQYNIKENPQGPKSGREKVLRGGCWYSNNPLFCNCTHRDFFPPYDAHWFYGFRCVKEVS